MNSPAVKNLGKQSARISDPTLTRTPLFESKHCRPSALTKQTDRRQTDSTLKM